MENTSVKQKTVHPTGKEFLYIKVEVNMKVNGKMVKKKEKEFFIIIKNRLKVIDMKAFDVKINKIEKVLKI